MTHGVSSATVGSAYANTLTKNTAQKEAIKGESFKQQTRVEKLKEQINSGEYKVDIDSLAKKMAEELVS